jgi:hypothetical protein
LPISANAGKYLSLRYLGLCCVLISALRAIWMYSFHCLPDAHITLFDMVQMQEELQTIFKRDVDLISKRGVENSRNYLRRKNILNAAQVIHVAR